MSKTSPADLAVAFRSLPRRVSESLVTVDSAMRSQADGHAASVTATVNAAAALLHVAAGSDLATTAEAVARKIAETAPDRWDDDVLDKLRTLALDAGASIRAIEALAS